MMTTTRHRLLFLRVQVQEVDSDRKLAAAVGVRWEGNSVDPCRRRCRGGSTEEHLVVVVVVVRAVPEDQTTAVCSTIGTGEDPFLWRFSLFNERLYVPSLPVVGSRVNRSL